MEISNNEGLRLQEVRRFMGLDLMAHPELQEIVGLAAELCEKPLAFLTMLDEQTNWLQVAAGIKVEAVPRATSFCRYTIEQDEVMVVSDATRDSRFQDNPYVVSDQGVQFYAGVPLVLQNGLKLGTLCVLDQKPGSLTPLQAKGLLVLSKQATLVLELQMSQTLLEQQVAETLVKNELLRKISFMQSHEIRHPLTNILGLVDLVKEGQLGVDDEWIDMLVDEAHILDGKINEVVTDSLGINDFRYLRNQKMVEEIEDYAILILDEKGNVENWNKGAEVLKGYKAKEIIGRNFSIFYTEEDKRSHRPQELIKGAIREGRARDTGWRVRKDGTRFWGSTVITAMHGYNGEVIGFTKVTRDLSGVLLEE
ncbi:PAS domain S-box protein [Salmonirosea aquatica]|uniref:histidine kinase n=1 Tax=Salmonirosea aquatica TaxID=2654236 RepID=A0A7C9BW77_9BACT|nr:PAS domain S-box protein [Cytophagaceae bacterium SJW1-29]